ncbi:hypothetical protein E2C01_059141 [Portunus trituberculatus]|uniref:Uncharacterized protein n=1 Tax=Portunus trituberculatus TaxID=210409 RepID=A0A5B7H6R8_PORTR|nr:hypothetical protein [Portunus trituberculatus]
MTAELLRSSPQKFSSLPALMVTMVPSLTSSSATTLKDMGSDLLERQWVGSAVHRMLGAPVFINSPGCSPPPLMPPMPPTSVAMSPALRHATVIGARGSEAPAWGATAPAVSAAARLCPLLPRPPALPGAHLSPAASGVSAAPVSEGRRPYVWRQQLSTA